MEYESDTTTNHTWNTQNNPQEPRKENEGTRNSEMTTALLRSVRILRSVLEN